MEVTAQTIISIVFWLFAVVLWMAKYIIMPIFLFLAFHFIFFEIRRKGSREEFLLALVLPTLVTISLVWLALLASEIYAAAMYVLVALGGALAGVATVPKRKGAML